MHSIAQSFSTITRRNTHTDTQLQEETTNRIACYIDRDYIRTVPSIKSLLLESDIYKDQTLIKFKNKEQTHLVTKHDNSIPVVHKPA